MWIYFKKRRMLRRKSSLKITLILRSNHTVPTYVTRNLGWSSLGNSKSSSWPWITKKHVHLLINSVWSLIFLLLMLELLAIKDRVFFSSVVKQGAMIAFLGRRIRKATQHALLEPSQRNLCIALSGLNIYLQCCSVESLKKVTIQIYSLTSHSRYLKEIIPTTKEEQHYSSQYLKLMCWDKKKVKRMLNSSIW